MIWDQETDVIVIGAGAAGLPAAIEAVESGAAVILLDANFDVGGHAIVSGGNVALGGGTSAQKQHGITDSPDLLFSDLTDWSVVQSNGAADYRYNDKEIIRAFADHSAPTFEWLLAHQVVFVADSPDNRGAGSTGNSAPREHHSAPMAWPLIRTGLPVAPAVQATVKGSGSGVGLIRPLEQCARKLGVKILLQHRMTSLIREQPAAGRVIGIAATHQGKTLNLRARKGVIIATGGSSGNVNFRRMFDPRLTEEYCGVAGEPYSVQDASGELAAMAIGASLWGAGNQTGEFGSALSKAARIGCQYGYVNLHWEPTSPIFPLARASGLTVKDYQNLILVNQAGLRFYDETAGQHTSNNFNAVKEYVPHSHRNAANIKYQPTNFLNAALAGTGQAVNGGGPIWAIFDAGAVEREKWTVSPPHVDMEQGFFFVADTIAELADRIVNKYQRTPMSAATLGKTVAKYNGYVEAGSDPEFDKPAPQFKIQTGPFYAAWATPVIHDTRVGLRINAACEVVNVHGEVIEGLYCSGESAGGFSMHGLARCVVQGRIAGRNAATKSQV